MNTEVIIRLPGAEIVSIITMESADNPVWLLAEVAVVKASNVMIMVD